MLQFSSWFRTLKKEKKRRKNNPNEKCEMQLTSTQWLIATDHHCNRVTKPRKKCIDHISHWIACWHTTQRQIQQTPISLVRLQFTPNMTLIPNHFFQFNENCQLRNRCTFKSLSMSSILCFLLSAHNITLARYNTIKQPAPRIKRSSSEIRAKKRHKIAISIEILHIYLDFVTNAAVCYSEFLHHWNLVLHQTREEKNTQQYCKRNKKLN